MTACEAQEIIAVTTLGEVEGHRTLSVGSSGGGDAQTEGRSKGANHVYEWVQVSNRSKKLRASFARVVGLAEVNVDVGDLVVSEKS